MVKVTQRAAVFAAICNVTGHTGEGVCQPTPEQRKQVNEILFMGFREGRIELSKEFDDSALKSYVSGLQSNWLRKDPRLNGNQKYVAKNPGSRAGSGDPQLKALKALIGTVTTDEDRAEIQSHIDARMNEIAATKQAATVDFSALPADLQAKYSK